MSSPSEQTPPERGGLVGGAPPPAFEPIAEGGAACSVRLHAFEGPLDLLLHLIRENELDITDLPIAQVANQYLEYLDLMRELRLDVAAEYLVMAATLAWIKSRMLLPIDEEAGDEEGGDPRAELVARLLEYERFKQAAGELERRPLLGREVFAPPGAELEPPAEGEREIEVGIVALLEALRRVLRQARAGDAIHEVVSDPVTVRERMVVVVDALERADAVEFADLFCGPDGAPATRALIVATFLAILELARMAVLRVFQSLNAMGVPEGPIRLRRAVAETALRERMREGV
jgi:segregation and condensation protein A